MERTFRQLAADKSLDFNVRFDAQAAANDPNRREKAAADRAQPPLKRLQVYREGRGHLRSALCGEGLEHEPPSASQCGARDRDFGHRQRDRYFRRQAEADLRAVPPSRWNDQPQIWRHGPRLVDQQGDRATARRRAPGLFEAGRRLDLHPLCAARDGGFLSSARLGNPSETAARSFRRRFRPDSRSRTIATSSGRILSSSSSRTTRPSPRSFSMRRTRRV